MPDTQNNNQEPSTQAGNSAYQGGSPYAQNNPYSGAGFSYPNAQSSYQSGQYQYGQNAQSAQNAQGGQYQYGQNAQPGQNPQYGQYQYGQNPQNPQNGYPGYQGGYQGGYPGGQYGGYPGYTGGKAAGAANQAKQMLSQVDWMGILRNVGKLFNPTYSGEETKTVNEIFERNSPIVPNHIQAEENEIVVKQYDIARLRSRLTFSHAEGRLMVTNRRVLFRAAGRGIGGHTLMQHQFNMDELAGVEMHNDFKFSALNFFGALLLYPLMALLPALLMGNMGSTGAVIMGLLLAILGVVGSAFLLNHRWLRLCATSTALFSVVIAATRVYQPGLLVLIGVVLLVLFLIALLQVCFVPNLVIHIKTKSGHNALEIGSQKTIALRSTGDDSCNFAEVLPWTDTIQAMNELGTMIDDFQKQGDYALNTWVNKQ